MMHSMTLILNKSQDHSSMSKASRLIRYFSIFFNSFFILCGAFGEPE